MKRLENCPYCNSNMGVYTKMDLINIPHCMNFDGTEGYNGEMYDNAEKIIYKQNVHCQNCDKVICRLKTFNKINGIED